MIPAAFDYVRADSVDERHQPPRGVRRGRQAARWRPLPAAADEAAPGGSGRPGRHRPAAGSCPTSARTATTSRIGALTRHRDLEINEVLHDPRPAAGPRRRPGRRSPGAPPRHHRRFAGPRRSGVGSAGGLPGARRHVHRRGTGGDAPDRGVRLLPGLPRDGPGPDEMLTEISVPKADGAGWSFQKFNRRAQDWAIVGVAAVDGARPGIGAGQYGPDRRCGPRRRGGARRRGVGRRGRGARRRRPRSARGSQREPGVPPAPGRGSRAPGAGGSRGLRSPDRHGTPGVADRGRRTPGLDPRAT